MLAVLAGGFLLAAGAVLLADYLGAAIAAAILNGIRLRMFEHLQKLSIGYYAQVRSGDVVARFTSDLTDIQKSLTTRIVDAVIATLGLAINIPVAFAIDWRLGLVMVLGMPVAGLGTRVFGRRAANSRYALKQQEAALASLVQESVRAQPVVKVFGLVGWLQDRFRAQLEDLRRRFVRAEFAAELVGSASSQGVLVTQVAGARRGRLPGPDRPPHDGLAGGVHQPARGREQGRLRPHEEGRAEPDRLDRRAAAHRGAARRAGARRRPATREGRSAG